MYNRVTLSEVFKLEKYCKYCDRVLPVTKFQKSKTCKDGRRGKCKECRNKDARNRHKIICQYCGKEGRAERKNSKFCSNECKFASKKNGRIVPCSFCGSLIYRKQYYLKQNSNHFCSHKCHAQFKSKYMVGKNNPKYYRFVKKCDGCGKNIEIIPSLLKIQEYHFCSYVCYKKNIGRFIRGKKHPKYNPNLTDHERFVNRDYYEYNKWRKEVFKKDGYTCMCCGDSSGGNLVAHHILNYSEYKHLRTEIKNGITMCEQCHKQFHDLYGYTNNNGFQLTEYLNIYSKISISL